MKQVWKELAMNKLFMITAMYLLMGRLLAQDTVFVSVDNTVYLTFPDKIELVDIGKYEEYVAEVSNGNLIKVKALSNNSKASTIMVKYGPNFKQFFLQVVPNPKKYHYDFGTAGQSVDVNKLVVSSPENTNTSDGNDLIVKEPTPGAEITTRGPVSKAKQQILLENCLKVGLIPTEEYTLGFLSKFLQASVTVIRNDKDYTYLKIALYNKSTLPYKFDFISFQYFQSMNKGFGKQKRKAPQDVYPILDNNNQTVPPLTVQSIVFVIPSFALANNGYLLVNFREKEGDRILKIKITSDKIQSAGILTSQ